ncbi:tripartite motif-containing protein 16-like isoform X2 [Alosa sapidissima]|uniref:tripartite motif-containing protein 16-like isoform X2 n=1 Tax=Alosa sapidissima TaxID=34773 RepID=UPI001C09174E|nr:tripartite motif-containing protein 16-like isoform X2 [Alosa sapidissima]
MAEAISSNDDILMCSICLDLLKDPVTLNCGHNYCTGCIKGCWDQEDQKGVYSCTQCRQTFAPRPVLNKNNVVAELVEQLRKTRVHAAPPALSTAGPGDVECDVCTGRKLKAVKSCLECLVSYCEIHFKVHNDANPRKHLVVDATGQLQERICSEHKKVLEIFCRTDQSCICYLCTMDEHKGHDTVTAAAEWKNKQKQLGQTQRRFQQRLQEREKELQELRKAVETLKSSAQTAVEDSERIFTEMIRSIERRRSEVTELIRVQEKAEVSRAEGLLKQLEQEIAELKRRDAELEQLSHTEDHIHFLKNIPSFRDSPRSKDLPSITFSQSFSFEAVKESVSAVKMQLEEKLEDIFKQEVAKISAKVAQIKIIQSLEYTDPELPVRRTNSKEVLPPAMSDVQAACPEPVTREELLQYSCHFTLDPNTAHRHLHLSEGNRRVECRAELQSYPDHPERFDGRYQVLCREGVSGRCYWEVEWRGQRGYIAVSYKSISRKGGVECMFGGNDQSWSLLPRSSSSSFCHNDKLTKLPLVASSRIGVYVDHRAGTLAFYSISDTMTLLHRVQTTFTHTLYPGFYIGTGSSVKLL